MAPKKITTFLMDLRKFCILFSFRNFYQLNLCKNNILILSVTAAQKKPAHQALFTLTVKSVAKGWLLRRHEILWVPKICTGNLFLQDIHAKNSPELPITFYNPKLIFLDIYLIRSWERDHQIFSYLCLIRNIKVMTLALEFHRYL